LFIASLDLLTALLPSTYLSSWNPFCKRFRTPRTGRDVRLYLAAVEAKLVLATNAHDDLSLC